MYDDEYEEDDYYDGDWTDPVHVVHRPKPTPKLYTFLLYKSDPADE